jgi:glucose-1-phosphate adenylyltransferase
VGAGPPHRRGALRPAADDRSDGPADGSADRAANRAANRPNLLIGEGTLIERAIIDKECRIGRNVRIVNQKGARDDEGSNYVIRDGIVCIPRGTIIPDDTVI